MSCACVRADLSLMPLPLLTFMCKLQPGDNGLVALAVGFLVDVFVLSPAARQTDSAASLRWQEGNGLSWFQHPELLRVLSLMLMEHDSRAAAKKQSCSCASMPFHSPSLATLHSF